MWKIPAFLCYTGHSGQASLLVLGRGSFFPVGLTVISMLDERLLYMRGHLKSDEYYAEKLAASDAELAHYWELTARVRAARGEHDTGVQNGYRILTSAYQKRINLLYTSGIRDHELPRCFAALLQCFARVWEPDDSYFELIKVLALAVLLNINSQNEHLLLLEAKIRETAYADYLVDLFLNHLDVNWNGHCSAFKWKNTYEPLKAVAECEDQARAVLLLQEYLAHDWYGIHKTCAWYNTHKSVKTAYYGYWSFEAAALAKILNLEDASLRGQSYYPYALAHWQSS